MVGIPRRGLIKTGLAAGLVAATSPVFIPRAAANVPPVTIIDGFAPRRQGVPLEREVGLVLDFSSSMNVSEVEKALSGVMAGVTESKLLSGDKDVTFCSGPIGIAIVTFKDEATQYGYMVLETPDDAKRARETLAVYFSGMSPSGNTNTGGGLDEMHTIFVNSPCSRPLPFKRMVFVIGDENHNKGDIKPATVSLALARDCAATTYGIGLVDGIYQDVPNPAMMTRLPGSSYPIEVEAGQTIVAPDAETIAAFMQSKIDPNCMISEWNGPQNRLASVHGGNRRFSSGFRPS